MYNNIIAIPYRKREKQLKHYIKHTVPLIQKFLPNTRVVVIEQNEGKLFNRGKILNVAFKEYENKTKYFLTNDVDLNPTQKCLEEYYKLENDIVRILTAHRESLGGVTKLHSKCIKEMNGFPNYIWGWGIEDRALYYRAIIKKFKILETKCNKSKSNFTILHHKTNNHVYKDEKHNISNRWRKGHINKINNEEKNKMVNDSGLNNIEYTILERKMLHEIVEIIYVDI